MVQSMTCSIFRFLSLWSTLYLFWSLSQNAKKKPISAKHWNFEESEINGTLHAINHFLWGLVWNFIVQGTESWQWILFKITMYILSLMNWVSLMTLVNLFLQEMSLKLTAHWIRLRATWYLPGTPTPKSWNIRRYFFEKKSWTFTFVNVFPFNQQQTD